MRSQLTEYLSADGTSEAEEEPLLELGPEDVLLLFIMMQNSLQLSLLSYNHQCHVVYSLQFPAEFQELAILCQNIPRNEQREPQCSLDTALFSYRNFQSEKLLSWLLDVQRYLCLYLQQIKTIILNRGEKNTDYLSRNPRRHSTQLSTRECKRV